MKYIEGWASDSHAYLSESTEYARGYKNGITTAKDIVKQIINANTKKPKKI